MAGEAKEKFYYIRPRNALKKLKAAETEGITAYIYGISGCGKTELIRRYFGKRKVIWLDAGEMKKEDLELAISGGRRVTDAENTERKVIVIDNLHAMALDVESEELREGIIHLIEREDIWLILIGRGPVPPWMSSVRYREGFYLIEERDLLFDRLQAEQYIEHTGMCFSGEQLTFLHEFCRGLPLAWQITIQNYKQYRMEDSEPTQPLCEERFRELLEQGSAQMWDYLEYHVYDQWDVALQEFLMEVSVVERFTTHLAEMITGQSNVEALLDRAKWVGNFMSEVRDGGEVWYVFRPEMRISMQRRMRRKYSKEKIRTLYENAGLYYQLHRKPLQALQMYEAVEDAERIATILIENVRTAPNSGYYYELKKYYLGLPEDKIRTSPELMCGMSMLQSLLLNTAESERWYEELQEYAKAHTGSERKLARGRLLYLDIGLPHRGSENMIEIMKRAGTLLLDKKVTLQEFSVTSNQASQMNGGKDFCEWSKRDRELAASIGKLVELVLGKYGKGLVNLALAESFLEKGEDNYEVASLANRGRMQAESGGKLEQSFVADGMLSWLHILTGKAGEAEELLLRFRKRVEQEQDNNTIAERLLPNIDTFIIRCALYCGKNTQADKWLAEAPDEELGFNIYDRFHYLTKVRIWLRMGRYEQAYGLLTKCEYYAQTMKRTYIRMEVGLLLAILQYRTGDPAWDETLSRTLTELEEYHFVRLVSREGAAILPLLEETGWTPTGDGNFWKQVREETRRMTRYYPNYLRPDLEEVVLSDTMLAILKLQAEGLSKEQIAENLHLTTSNVKYHTQQIYRKLGVGNKTEAVREAGKRGIL